MKKSFALPTWLAEFLTSISSVDDNNLPPHKNTVLKCKKSVAKTSVVLYSGIHEEKEKKPQKPKDEEQYMSDKTPRLKLVSSLVIPARLQTRSTREGRSEVMWVGGCVCCTRLQKEAICKKRSVLHQESKRSSLEPKRKFLSCAKLQKEEVWVWNPKKKFCFVLSCKRRKSEFGTRSDLSSCDKSAKEETNCFFQIKAKERCCVLLLLLWTPKKLQTPFVLWTN